jgi:hypothetical protein
MCSVNHINLVVTNIYIYKNKLCFFFLLIYKILKTVQYVKLLIGIRTLANQKMAMLPKILKYVSSHYMSAIIIQTNKVVIPSRNSGCRLGKNMKLVLEENALRPRCKHI